MTYVLLIYASSPALSSADEQIALAAHRALQAETAARAQLHAVARLDGPETARTIRRRSGAHETTDGPYLETKEWLIGFYLVDCDDEAEAMARARQIISDDSHVIEVRPVCWRWES
jgi:hypothetical protein